MKRDVHIFINSLSARRGGGQTYLINLLQHLKPSHGVKVTLLVSKQSTLGLNHPLVHRLIANFPVENPVVRGLWEKFYLPLILKRENPDIFFCPGGILGSKAPRNCKTVTMFRNMIPFDRHQRRSYPYGLARLRNWLLYHLMLGSMERADLVIFISQFAKNVIEGVAKKIHKSVVIPHGVGEIFRNPAQLPRPVYLPDSSYGVYASTIDFYKSQLEVVEAYHLLQLQGFKSPPLLLIGAGEKAYTAKVKSLIHQYKLENDIILVGQVPYDQMPRIYKDAHFILFASQSENCPNILLESMAAGRPILCSNLPPMPEFGSNAVKYFDPTSPQDLAERIKELLNNFPEMRDLELRAKGRASEYQWSNTADRTWSELRQLVTL